MSSLTSGYFSYFNEAIDWAIDGLIANGDYVDAGKWQGIQTQAHPSLVTKEILNLRLEVPLWRDVNHYGDNYAPLGILDRLAEEIQPNKKWADEHFQERVGGVPLNPDPSHERWPWWRGQDDSTKVDGKFSHTYSERFWPKWAPPEIHKQFAPGGTASYAATEGSQEHAIRGIRYAYGDLDDVVNQLIDEPMNRQAYLPIFFPEDTGAVHGGRVPCTLGYHFLVRDERLHMWYDIRSCDVVRHFRDDIYLAVRLQLWMLDTIRRMEQESVEEEHQHWSYVKPGTLYFCAHSFHVHMGDIHRLPRMEP